jgi:hypothetical protein
VVVNLHRGSFSRFRDLAERATASILFPFACTSPGLTPSSAREAEGDMGIACT